MKNKGTVHFFARYQQGTIGHQRKNLMILLNKIYGQNSEHNCQFSA